MKSIFPFLLLLILFSCKNETPRYPGICLSFDDRSVREWYTMKELLKEYDAKVTFFITQFDSLDSDEIMMLKELEDEGHEIGGHGAFHVNARDYLLKNSYKDYMKKEIEAGILTMKKAGFNPESFAYPFGTKFFLTDFLLLKKFKNLRGVAGISPEDDITSLDKIYYSFNNDRTLFALGIDRNSGLTSEMIRQAIKRAKDSREVLLLYGHSPGNVSDSASYTFDMNVLKFILTEARKNDLQFFKMGELVN